MNLEDRESESRPAFATQSQVSKHAFEWPDDQQDFAVPAAPNEKWIQSNHLSVWVAFWCATWAGTAIAGSLFGGVLGLFGIGNDPTAPFVGLISGALWAGAVGLFVFVHLGVICWTFWRLGKPLTIGTIAGAVTGVICGLVLFSVVTAPLGAVGAYVAGNSFLKSTTGKEFLETIKKIQNESLGTMKFTVMDLLLRVTALAVFIGGWSAWLKYIVALHRQ